jgi:threonine/homoserine/homoserine lactone efflux protein
LLPVDASWGSVLSKLVALAAVIALSPITVIPAVLVLHAPRARPAALMYLVGWVIGLAVLTAIFLAVSGLVGDINHPPKWASWLRIIIGAALIVFGVFRWFTRHRSAHTPAFVRQLSSVTPAKAGVTGAVLAVVNPKVLFICAAAGLAIGTEGIGEPGVWLAVAYFVAIAASSVALPVLAYAVSGERLDPALSRLKDWMQKHNAALVAGILIVIGLLVLYKGIHAV